MTACKFKNYFHNTVKMMKCPFDPAHIMPYQRFLNHLEKCQFPDKKMYKKCKFNPYHVFHQNEVQEHQNRCPDKKKFEVDDDDWGVSDEPEQKTKVVEEIADEWDKKEIQSHASLNTNASSKTSEGAKKYKKYVPAGKDKILQNSREQKSINILQNSLMQVEDLQTFNAPIRRKYQR